MRRYCRACLGGAEPSGHVCDSVDLCRGQCGLRDRHHCVYKYSKLSRLSRYGSRNGTAHLK